MKKQFLLGLVLLLVVCLSGVAFAQEVTLKVWLMKQAEVELIKAQEEALAEFQKLYPDINVEFTVFPYNEYRDKLLIAAAAGNPPDVSVVDQIWNPEFAAAGFIMPLDDYVAQSPNVKKEDYFSGAWESAIFQGKLYGIPFDVGVWALNYYNKDFFRNVGLDPEQPPVTWDEFYEMGSKMTSGEQWGTALYVGAGDAVQCITDALIFSNGGSVLDQNFRKCTLDQPPAVEALKYFKKLQGINPPGEVARTEEDSFQLFTAGKVGMFWYGEWGQDTVNARAPEMDWALANFPRPAEGESIGTFGGWNMVIYQNASQKDAAWKFVEFWTSKEINEKVSSLTPANIEAAQAFLNQKRRFPEIIFQQLATALYRPIFPRYPDLAEIQRNATTHILLDQKSVEEALKDATREIDTLLDEYYTTR
ncbi:MAG: multiple sugar transport system substrate-binding protein [Candidatus Atribacteria bacterium]|nr:multiple sugar transport system substrate-binding protein [Candidatus Atribacteria bacterium]